MKDFFLFLKKKILECFSNDFSVKEDLLKIRIKFIFFCFCSLGFIYSFKFFYSIFFVDNVVKSSNVNSFAESKLFRRNIYDRNGVLIASSIPVTSIAINPNHIFDRDEAIKSIIKIFPELSYDGLLKSFSSGKKFVWIKRNILPEDERLINQAGIPGLIFEREFMRIYPHSNVASFVLGYVDVDQNGIAGVEKNFNDFLFLNDLYLSIDIRIQNIAFNALKKHVKLRNADGGIIIIADLKKSEILASVSLPDFNPHYPSRYKEEELFNRASLGTYELGSIWKPMTVASALDAKVIKIDDKFDITPPLRIGRNSINDFVPPRDPIVDIKEILKRSSNIGTSKIALKMGANLQKEYFKKFGFFDSLDIGIPEVSKNIFPKKIPDISVATMSYGHGFAITPMHFIMAFASIVNGGKLCKLSFIKRGTNNGLLSSAFDDKIVCHEVISKKVSNQMRGLLRAVVEHGGSRRADAKLGEIDNYCVGGKAGTAIKIKNGKYTRLEDLTSFVGAFPMYDPQYVIFVNLDTPRGANRFENTGAFAAAPIAKDFIDQILPILELKIEREKCFFD
jgi:cell division protein FtsI (penicillin-binding protein 3)